MISFADRKRRFSAISPTIRLTFLASCAERIMPIYDKFWVGDYHPELSQTIELAWQTVEGGSVDAASARRCFDVAKELADLYAEDSIAPLAEAAGIAAYIMDMLQQTDHDDVALAAPRGYASVLTAGDAVDGVLAQNGIVAPSAKSEEEAWLDAAVARAETWTQPAARDMFRDLGSFPPSWWAVYSNVKRPY